MRVAVVHACVDPRRRYPSHRQEGTESLRLETYLTGRVRSPEFDLVVFAVQVHRLLAGQVLDEITEQDM